MQSVRRFFGTSASYGTVHFDRLCSRCGLRERDDSPLQIGRRTSGNGTCHSTRFFLGGGQKHYMFCPRRQAVFSVTRNRFRNRKQLARKGRENSSEVVVFYRAPRVPTRISILQNVFTLSARNLLHRSSETSRNKDKNKGQKAAPAKRTSDNSTQKKAVSTGDYCVKQRTGLRSNSSSQRTSSVLGRPSERRA